MKKTAFAIALMVSGAALAPTAATAAAQAAPAAAPRKIAISKQATKSIIELQTAVTAKDYAKVPALVAAANAQAKNADDKYMIASLQLRAAAAQNDNAAIGTAIEAMVASGAAQPSELGSLYLNLGKIRFQQKNFPAASQAFDQLLKIDPTNGEATILQAETLAAQNQAGPAVEMFRKAIAAKAASGQTVEESWYKRAVALAYNNKLPAATALSRDWVKAYPTPTNWRDSLRIYQQSSGLDDSDLIDVMRLARATKALAGESDYFRYANALMLKGFPGEAKAVMDEGFASGSIKKTSPTFAGLYAKATANAVGDRAGLAAAAKTALAAPTARQAMVNADAYLGYGDYAKAAELYRAALTKSGVDKDTANLRLGIALAGAGDKAGATAALNAVSGAKAETARYWLLYLGTKA